MCVEHARRKRAYNISADFECLMNRWRLMYRSGDRLEILRVESEWIEITIPADRIEWMMRQRHPRKSRSIFYENIDVFLLIDCHDFSRTGEVPLRVRRAHLDLPLVILVTFRSANRSDRFGHEIILLLDFVRAQPG